MEEILNKKFNKLKIIENLENNKNGHKMVKCLCDCGRIKNIKLSAVLSNRTRSCGCNRHLRKIETGFKFGLLTVVSEIKDSISRTILCKCECGKLKEISSIRLVSGRLNSCGCRGKTLDILGKKFNHLTVIEIPDRKEGQQQRVTTKCDCGELFECKLNDLKVGNNKTCKSKKCTYRKLRNRNGINSKYKRACNAWYGIIQRCYYPNNHAYYRYGGRGIDVCSEWRNITYGLELFVKWYMENWNGDKSFTVDRIDNDKGYSPYNCRFADKSTQANNTRVRKEQNIRKYVTKDNTVTYRITLEYKGYKRIEIYGIKTIEEAILTRNLLIVKNNFKGKLLSLDVKILTINSGNEVVFIKNNIKHSITLDGTIDEINTMILEMNKNLYLKEHK